ncbi:MAG: hypothetical protein KJ697_02815 [Nanoarchaeota archaeon]|nr:hypothetical protein [Nanoarchaeota archaeon]MBU4124084.1 hypothetical protein [Nanoarchaeota archaeon]
MVTDTELIVYAVGGAFAISYFAGSYLIFGTKYPEKTEAMKVKIKNNYISFKKSFLK